MSEPSRLDAIEIKLAHLERALHELGSAVTRQQREIEILISLNRQLRQQLEVLGSAPGSELHERPPHY